MSFIKSAPHGAALSAFVGCDRLVIAAPRECHGHSSRLGELSQRMVMITTTTTFRGSGGGSRGSAEGLGWAQVPAWPCWGSSGLQSSFLIPHRIPRAAGTRPLVSTTPLSLAGPH